MSDDQKKRDAVTVGQISARIKTKLERQICELASTIRSGSIQLHRAETFLKTDIAATLGELEKINSQAGVELLFPTADDGGGSRK